MYDTEIIEEIQRIVAKLIATNPPGRNLVLIGGFRYRLLDDSPRMSVDIDYHWEESLSEKQKEIVLFLEKKFVPELKHRFGYDAHVRLVEGPETESTMVKMVDVAFYSPDIHGSKRTIRIDITCIDCIDKPTTRTKDGVIYLTATNQDMIESKIISLLCRIPTQERDFLDIFLFKSQLSKDSPERVLQKLEKKHLDLAKAHSTLEQIVNDKKYHVKNVSELIESQLDVDAANQLNQAGGAGVVFDGVINSVQAILTSLNR
jgi:predicted nucleotidyltransferase component of viral defense system